MKKILLIPIIILIHFNIKSQSALGIVGSLTVSPSYTVTNGTTIYVAANVQNKGTTTITGSIGLKMAIDISATTGIPNYVFRAVAYFNVTNFAPNAIITQTVSDVAANYNQYKTNGGGVTVVVWPIYSGGSSTTTDSAQTVIYVTLLNGIDDRNSFENSILKMPNPISQNIKLNYDDEIFRTVTLLDVTGKTIQVIEDKELNTTFLVKGLYYLNFYNSLKHQIITKKILIE